MNTKFLILIILIIFISGCGSQNYKLKYNDNYYSNNLITNSGGIYHKVKKGQTLWRIAREYSIDINDIIRINNIKNSEMLEPGQLIFIPDVKNRIDVSVRRRMSRISSEKKFIYPVKGRLKSRFGQKINGIKNKGIDIVSSYGALILSSKTGVVSHVDNNMRGLGKVVILDHQDGYITVYSHFSDIIVTKGDVVRQGQKIGYAGSTGSAKENMLHFEIRKNAKPVDPILLLV